MSKIEEMLKRLCPEGVERRPLAQAVSVKRGVRVVKQQLAETGDYPVYQNCLTAMGYYAESNCSGDTAFVIAAGAAGSVGYCDVDFWAADDCYYMVAPKEINNKFLYYALKSKEPLLLSKVRKASVPRLARDVVESMEIPLPPRPVQDEIVKALDVMDAAVKALEEERAARQEQFEAVREKVMLSKVQGAERIRVGDACVRVVDGMHILPTTSSDASGVPVLSAQNINHGEIDLLTSKFVSEEVYVKENNRTNVARGDLLLTIVGAVGRTAVVKTDLRALFQRSVCVLKFKSCWDTTYVKRYLESDEAQSYIRNHAHGGIQKGLYLDQVKEVKIPHLPLSVQKKIAAQLDAFAAVVAALDEEIAARREQFAGWLEKLMKFETKEVA